MPYRHFQVPCSGGEVEAAMTAFLHQHRVLKVEKQFVAAGLDSFWAYQVHYDDQPKPAPAPGISDSTKKGMIDYKSVLNDADFTLFLKLKDWRKERAQKDAVEPFTIFTNAQLWGYSTSGSVPSRQPFSDGLAEVEEGDVVGFNVPLSEEDGEVRLETVVVLQNGLGAGQTTVGVATEPGAHMFGSLSWPPGMGHGIDAAEVGAGLLGLSLAPLKDHVVLGAVGLSAKLAGTDEQTQFKRHVESRESLRVGFRA